MKIKRGNFIALIFIGGLIGVFSPYIDRHAFDRARRQVAESALEDDSAAGRAKRFGLGAGAGALIGLLVFLEQRKNREY